MYKMLEHPVECIHREVYAVRQDLTNVLIRNLLTDVQIKVKCEESINKMAIYKERYARN